MKITRVETHVCHARMRNWIFVKVLTDQDGLHGWGEATLEWHTRGVVAAIEDLSQLVVGENPTRVEHIWQMMHRQHFWHGNGIERATAIAGANSSGSFRVPYVPTISHQPARLPGAPTDSGPRASCSRCFRRSSGKRRGIAPMKESERTRRSLAM